MTRRGLGNGQRRVAAARRAFRHRSRPTGADATPVVHWWIVPSRRNPRPNRRRDVSAVADEREGMGCSMQQGTTQAQVDDFGAALTSKDPTFARCSASQHDAFPKQPRRVPCIEIAPAVTSSSANFLQSPP